MYDSRTDSDLPRRAWNHDGEDTAEAHARFRREGCKANRDMGEGDRIEYNTPKTRQLAAKRMTRKAIAEGVTEHLDALEAEAEERYFAECEADYAYLDAFLASA